MGFFSRNKEEKKVISQIPELPDMKLPELPDMSQIDNVNELKPLPKLPENAMGNSLGLQAIKSNVGFKQKTNEDSIEEANQEKKTIEMTDLEGYRPPKYSEKAQSPIMNREPVFIKLDKYKDAVEKFGEIKDKVQDIEDTLARIKEIKQREDEELKAWEEEVQMIKEKVANIDSSLFNRV